MNSFGTRLKHERKRLKLTQNALATLGGVEPNAQTSYETGKRWPRVDYLQRINIAGVDINFLMTGERLSPETVKALSPNESPLLPALPALPASPEDSRQVASVLIASLSQNLTLTASTIAVIATTQDPTKAARDQIAEGLRDLHSEAERFTTLVHSLARPAIRD